METNKISLKQMMETKDAVAYLEDLIKSFNVGKVVVQQGEDYVDLMTPEMVDIKVEAKIKKNKSKFSLELSWRTLSADATETVTISSKTPPKPAQAIKDKAVSPAKNLKTKNEQSIPSSSDAEEEILFGPGSRKKKKTARKPATAPKVQKPDVSV